MKKKIIITAVFAVIVFILCAVTASAEGWVHKNTRSEPKYILSDGTEATNVILKIDGERYAFGPRGLLICDNWVLTKSGSYYATNEDGIVISDNIVFTPMHEIRNLNEEGVCTLSTDSKAEWYLQKDDGTMYTYVFSKSGTLKSVTMPYKTKKAAVNDLKADGFKTEDKG